MVGRKKELTLNRSIVLIPVVAALILMVVWFTTLPDSLVVYCAHDAVYAKEILDQFTRETGIPVETRFDTEATKSLGLINLILRERQYPRCDVFWNNELLGMIELQEQGLLEPYQGTGWNRIPEQYRDPQGYWVGFAARMRVILFNSQQVSADDETLQTLMTYDPGRLAIAKPIFGTTLTHYTVLWHLWGADRLKAWHNDLQLRGLRIVNGNAAVKDVVAMGTCDAGLTDTDDAFVAIDDGYDVEMQPVRLTEIPANRQQPANDASGAALKRYTLCIPNTVGIIKGTKRSDAARKLVDYLASAETEIALAKAKSRQIPLGPVDAEQLSEEVRKLTDWSREGIDLRSLLPDRRECLKWLQDEYLK